MKFLKNEPIEPSPALHLTPIDKSVGGAICNRRSIRNFTSEVVKDAVIREICEAAVRAPSALEENALVFAVIQNQSTLSRISESIRASPENQSYEIHLVGEAHTQIGKLSPDFRAFYNAGALVLICGRPKSSFVECDGWLAAENLMLAAYAAGLGTCVIGCSILTLNQLEWKRELGIPADVRVIAPIIVGFPSVTAPEVLHKPVQYVSWIK